MKPRKPSKVKASTLAGTASLLKTRVENKLEAFIKDTKREKELDEMLALFSKCESSKEKAEYLEAFQKSEKTLAVIVNDLNTYQEALAKFETTLKEKVLDKQSSVVVPDSRDPLYEDDRKKIGESIQSIQTLIITAKQKLKTLFEKAEMAMKLQDKLKPEVQKFGIKDVLHECDREAEKLSHKLEAACKLVSLLSASGKPIQLSPRSKKGIEAFLPGYRERRKKSDDLFDATAGHLQKLLQGPVQEAAVAAPAAIAAAAIVAAVAKPE